MKSNNVTLKVLVCIKKDGPGYHAFCPSLKGLHVGGDTLEETKQNAKDAVEAYLYSLIKHNEPIPLGIINKADMIRLVFKFIFSPKKYENYELAATVQ